MSLTISSTIKLSNGVKMPLLGFGTYQVRPGKETRDAVGNALQIGYRHIDTARYYDNEADVGLAIRESCIPRKEIFITTKLANPDHGYERAMHAFERSNLLLGLEYVDLYLIHWPVQGKRGPSWKALERILKEGRCRAIGVSNYMIPHLKELEQEAEIVPMVDQVELSPYLAQKMLRGHCLENDIVIEAYSPLTRGKRFKDPALMKLAERYGRTPAQIMIRWAVQIGAVPLPKSTHADRARENANVFDFELNDDDMAELDNYNEGLHVSWDPTHAP
jgi:diketogulonate reductase-like aldo/keto reductase